MPGINKQVIQTWWWGWSVDSVNWHTAVSLATAEAAWSKAPRRIPLGIQTFAAAAAVGTTWQVVSMKFDRPIPVYPWEFVAISAKNLGVVTTTGVVTFLVTYDYGWIL